MQFKRNSTIGVKQKICKSCGKPCYWFSKQRCQSCSTIETTMARMEQENEKVIQEEDLGDLLRDADTIFSQYVRLKNTDTYGVAKCFTCGIKKHWTILQNGHYIVRMHLYLRFDERNCRPQCAECNELDYGNMKEYTKRLENESPGITEILKAESILVYKPSRDEIRQIISEYTPKVKELKRKLNY